MGGREERETQFNAVLVRLIHDHTSGRQVVARLAAVLDDTVGGEAVVRGIARP